jgi:uncharacterized membrane protein YphA (DoxX/SURF4 family)
MEPSGGDQQRSETMWERLVRSTGPTGIILIRAMVGAVFLSEGIQKFLFPDELGAGRFLKIGLPMPDLLGPFVGRFEIVCGSLVLLGLLTRLAVIPLIVIMAVALITTKWPMLAAQGSGTWRTRLEPTGRPAGLVELWPDRRRRRPDRRHAPRLGRQSPSHGGVWHPAGVCSGR